MHITGVNGSEAVKLLGVSRSLYAIFVQFSARSLRIIYIMPRLRTKSLAVPVCAKRTIQFERGGILIISEHNAAMTTEPWHDNFDFTVFLLPVQLDHVGN